ncbi:MAG: hypothetical protein WBX18_00185 [Terracidiphilus sp.]
MSEVFQRLFTMSETEILPLNEQAALGPARPPERSQFQHLVRHYLERFFNHETASPDGDAKARLVLIAFTAGLPGLMVAVYLWPVYHPFRGWPPGHPSNGGPPPYWLEVNHHFFFVVYSFVVMGIVTVFEWDLFFPDLLDILVLTALPVPDRRLFLARVSAIAIFIAGFLFDANIFALLVLPEAIDPPSLLRFLAGHDLAVALAGVFAAGFVLALQGVLLSILGERLFRKLSLLLQGLSISALLILLLLFPVFSAVVPALLQSGSRTVLCLPPFWFLGVYQRLMEGPSALPIYSRLAQIGCAATLLAAALAILFYPLAYWRRVHQLVEGAATRSARSFFARPLHGLLHILAVRPPVRRAVFHFIGQTLVRVPRYRIYLVLYGGVGLAVVAAGIVRFTVDHNQVRVEISADGLRAATAIVAFWVIAGLRMAFVSSGNQRGSWVFRVVHGSPPDFVPALERLLAAKTWVLLSAGVLTLGTVLASRAIAPPRLLGAPATAAQLLVAAALCLLLTDLFFLNVTAVAFTGNPARQPSNLALTMLKYFTFFPLVIMLPHLAEPWIQRRWWHFAVAACAVAVAHGALAGRHRAIVEAHCHLPDLEEGEEDFPMRLGLRS